MLLIFQRLEDIEAIDVCLHGCMHLHPYLSWPSFYFLIKTISTKCMLSLSSPQNKIVIIQWELFLIILQSKVVQTLDNLTNTTPFKKWQKNFKHYLESLIRRPTLREVKNRENRVRVSLTGDLFQKYFPVLLREFHLLQLYC